MELATTVLVCSLLSPSPLDLRMRADFINSALLPFIMEQSLFPVRRDQNTKV